MREGTAGSSALGAEFVDEGERRREMGPRVRTQDADRLVAAIEAAEAQAVALDDQRAEVKRRWADCPYPRPKTRCADVPSERGRPVDWTRHTRAHAEAYRAAHLAWAAAFAEHRRLLAAGSRWLRRTKSAHLN